MKTYYNDAKETFNTEITALEKVRDELDESFDQVVEEILDTTGRLIFIAIGKSGIIAEKIAASFSSIGVSSFFIDAGNAFHGDLGRVSADDLVFLSLIVVRHKKSFKLFLLSSKFLGMISRPLP